VGWCAGYNAEDTGIFGSSASGGNTGESCTYEEADRFCQVCTCSLSSAEACRVIPAHMVICEIRPSRPPHFTLVCDAYSRASPTLYPREWLLDQDNYGGQLASIETQDEYDALNHLMYAPSSVGRSVFPIVGFLSMILSVRVRRALGDCSG
jgi:hypothetical protein